ncbi:MAG: hypothetical protein A4E73_00162 [Syntrophaceae bacterium PtaU1.Bin231]|nr:MAG: hypothetical protein A4E73_00162 [Syntrophaceae bacterium PtaU1.Bin231]
MRPVFGKTLFSILLLTALFFALSATSALAAVRGPAADKNRLPAELKDQDIKTFYAPAGTKKTGTIQTVIGQVIVAPDAGNPYYAAAGDTLFEKDVVITLAGSRCRFQLIGGDVAMIGENTHLGIKSFKRNPEQGTRSSILTVHKGKAMFYTLQSLKFRNNLMQVEIPTAVCRTSGAKWGVEVTEMPRRPLASRPILVADNSPDGGFRHLATYYYTGQSMSGTVTSAIGPVTINSPTNSTGSVMLTSGQMATVGPGAGPTSPVTTPQAIASAFLASTFVPASGDGVAPPSPQVPGGSIVLNNPTPGGTPLRDDTNLVQQQNASTRPTRHEGFAVGMLTNGGGAGTYISPTSQDFDAGQGMAYNATPYARMSTTTLEELQVLQGTAGNLPQTLVKNELGYNAYMEWGSWTQPVEMSATGGPYVFNNKGYYVWGDRTTTLPATISGTYRGDAYGTIWSAGGGTDLGKGTVSMDISYAGGAGTISNFNLLIGNTGIQNGTATFNTTGNYMVTGTGLVAGQTGTGTANGNFYGPSANWTGGVWKAEGGGQNANGNFVATKQ